MHHAHAAQAVLCGLAHEGGERSRASSRRRPCRSISPWMPRRRGAACARRRCRCRGGESSAHRRCRAASRHRIRREIASRSTAASSSSRCARRRRRRAAAAMRRVRGAAQRLHRADGAREEVALARSRAGVLALARGWPRAARALARAAPRGSGCSIARATGLARDLGSPHSRPLLGERHDLALADDQVVEHAHVDQRERALQRLRQGLVGARRLDRAAEGWLCASTTAAASMVQRALTTSRG